MGKRSPYELIGVPVITEKTMYQAQEMNTYTFRVDSWVNKNDVKLSLKAIYDVVPKSVRIINVPYKWRMQRKLVRRAYKKAIVTLKEWDKIDLAA